MGKEMESRGGFGGRGGGFGGRGGARGMKNKNNYY